MDSGLAIVIGAAIALLGAVGAPWVREIAERRTRKRDAEDSTRRLAIIDITIALTQMARYEPFSIEYEEFKSKFSVANMRLALSVGKEGSEVVAMLDFAEFWAFAKPYYPPENMLRQSGPLAADIASTLLMQWYIGQKPAKGINDLFNELLMGMIEHGTPLLPPEGWKPGDPMPDIMPKKDATKTPTVE